MGGQRLEDLVENIMKGQEEAFRTIYQIYNQKVYKTALMMTGNEKSAEDIMQEVFTTVFCKIHRLKCPAAFESWLYKIVMNSCHMHLRKNKRNIIMEKESFDQIEEKDINFIPEDIVIKSEINRKLDKCINELSEKLRVCIILFYFNNFSIREIANILECSEGTVKSRLSNAKKQLEKMMRDNV